MDVAPSRRAAFMELQEGQQDPTFGKLVDTLIVRSPDYIVYLDEELFVWWATDLDINDHAGSAEVLNRVSWLEAKPIYMLDENQRRTYRRMLGEGIARMLAGRVNEATAILDRAEGWIAARSQEAARRWLLLGSAVPAAPLIVLAVAVWTWRDVVSAHLGATETELIVAACLGAVGALLSIIWRTGTKQWEPEAGARLHYYEATARIVAGVVGAIVMSLAVRADLVGGVFVKASSHSAIFLLAFVSGFSERLVPGFVTQVETSIVHEHRAKDGEAEPDPEMPFRRRNAS